MIKPTLIDLNSFKLNYYHFMVSLDKCNGICNAVDDLSKKKYVPGQKKDVIVKIFNLIGSINEVKTLVKHISFDCKCQFVSTKYNSNQKLDKDICQCECKESAIRAKKIIIGILANVFVGTIFI